MKKAIFLFLIIFISASCRKAFVTKDNYQTTSAEFKSPQVEYSSAPFYVWNSKMTKADIEYYLKDFKSKGILQVFIHPRPGMITSYLTDEWFELFTYAVEFGKSLGMKIWIYDENSYPSGFAGGGVPAAMPEAAGKNLVFYRTSKPDTLLNPWAIYRKEGINYVEADSREYMPGEYLIAILKEWGTSQWYGGFSYVDLMQKKVTEKFIDLTMKEYQKRYDAEFGNTIPGVFMDEPNISPESHGGISVHYTPELFNAFKKKWGYDLKPELPLLFEETGDYRKVRHNYYSILLDLFIKNWAIPYSDYCKQNNILLTGHYWDHEWPNPGGVPDNMALAAFSTMPGIDLLFNNWYTGYSAQFGNSRMVKELRSVANQMGYNRTLSETYGGAGWDLSFKDQKRILDWECALGVNLVNQHLSHQTIVGFRKRDYPQTFSYHEPWWDDYKMMADYITRLSFAMSKGAQVNKILVLEPTTTGWMNHPRNWHPNWRDEDGWKEGKTGELCISFHSFIEKLEFNQVEYDLGCEDMMKRFGGIEGKELKIGKASYSLVILPPSTENLDKETVSLIGKYLQAGGKVLSFSGVPEYMDGSKSELLKNSISDPARWINGIEDNIAGSIFAINKPSASFSAVPAGSLLFHQIRELSDARLVFIANIHDSLSVSGDFSLEGGSVEKWNLFTGKVEDYPFERENKILKIHYTLPAAGSILLCVKEKKQSTVTTSNPSEKVIPYVDSLIAERLFPNVLTIDYCDLRINGKTKKDFYVTQACAEVFREFGFEDNPWNGVQYKDNTIRKDSFANSSGFEADFWLTIDKDVDIKNLKIVCERPEIFKLSVNGQPVQAVKGEYYIDRDFAVYEAGDYLKPGKNKITQKVSPMSVFAELESIYILGDFAVKPQKFGFSIVPSKKLSLGAWTQAGMQFYGNKVSYSHTIDLIPEKDKKYFVRLKSWRGTLADVVVNGTKAGMIAWDPYELDITGFLTPGKNEVKIQVCGSLYNTLGPHHNTKKLGQVDPWKFIWFKEGKTLRGDDYNFIDYGLFEEFEIVEK
jgi:hypothetical protein